MVATPPSMAAVTCCICLQPATAGCFTCPTFKTSTCNSCLSVYLTTLALTVAKCPQHRCVAELDEDAVVSRLGPQFKTHFKGITLSRLLAEQRAFDGFTRHTLVPLARRLEDAVAEACALDRRVEEAETLREASWEQADRLLRAAAQNVPPRRRDGEVHETEQRTLLPHGLTRWVFSQHETALWTDTLVPEAARRGATLCAVLHECWGALAGTTFDAEPPPGFARALALMASAAAGLKAAVERARAFRAEVTSLALLLDTAPRTKLGRLRVDLFPTSGDPACDRWSGWHDGAENGGAAASPAAATDRCFPCAAGCGGSWSASAPRCAACSAGHCSKCHAAMDSGHLHGCDPDAAASAANILATTRACPSCVVPVHRVSGCEQMMCPLCHTLFLYTTGEIVRSTEALHNPLYLSLPADVRDAVRARLPDGKAAERAVQLACLRLDDSAFHTAFANATARHFPPEARRPRRSPALSELVAWERVQATVSKGLALLTDVELSTRALRLHRTLGRAVPTAAAAAPAEPVTDASYSRRLLAGLRGRKQRLATLTRKQAAVDVARDFFVAIASEPSRDAAESMLKELVSFREKALKTCA